MLTCENAQPWFSSYLDSNLPSPVSDQLEAHLLHCPKCAHDVFTQKLIVDRLRDLDCQAIPSDSLRSRILRALQSDNPHCNTSPSVENRIDFQLPFPLEH
ncbi:MAG: anti-sigma factor family protein [Armatimonadaceae bacterium]|jgi:hypothetical protein